MELTSARLEFLIAALPQIAFDGWSRATMADTVKSLGLKAGEVQILFPRGSLDLIDLFMGWADQQMAEQVKADPNFESLKIRQKIAQLVKYRLMAVEDHREAVRKAVGVLTLPDPRRQALALKGLWRTMDLMWRLAGDTSTDFNHYTKRTLLLGVYTSTLAVWLEDKSPDYGDSWAFLDRRIEDVMQIQKSRSRFENFLQPLKTSSFTDLKHRVNALRGR